MKKIITILFALLLLVGCETKGYSKLSDGSDVIFSGPNNTSFTKNDLYESLKVFSTDSIEKDLVNKIAEKEELDLSTLNSEVEELLNMYLEMGYEYYLVQYYGSIDAFKNDYISNGIMSMLAHKYVEENYDTFITEDKPVLMKMASFDTKEAASKVIDDVNSGSTFEMACASNGYGDEIVETVYLDSDTALDYYVKEYLNTTDKTGLSTVIESSSAASTNNEVDVKYTYYVLDVIDRNVDNFKDTYISKKVLVSQDVDVKKYMFNKHDIEFFDQDIYELMKAQYEVFE